MDASNRVYRLARSARQPSFPAAVAVLLLASFSWAQAKPGDTTVIASSSAYPQMSTDGRYVRSGLYRDLLPENELGANLFVFDRSTGQYESINDKDSGHSLNGGSWLPQAAMSGNGRYVIWCSYFRVLVRDRVAGSTTPLMIHDRPYRTRDCDFAFNEDGRFLAFESPDSSLVPDDTNGQRDMFVLDRSTNSIERVSVSSSGAEADGPAVGLPMLNADGRFAVFASHATNLVPGDTNDDADLFVRDRATGVTTRINVDAEGAQAEEGVEYFYFYPNGRTISADGRFVTFASYASTLVPGDPPDPVPTTHAYVVDRDTGTVERVERQCRGPARGWRFIPALPQCRQSVCLLHVECDESRPRRLRCRRGRVRARPAPRTHRARERLVQRRRKHQPHERPVIQLGGSLSGDGRFVAFSPVADLAEGVSPYGLNVYLHENGGTDYWVFAVTPSRADFGQQSVSTSSAPMRFTVTNDSTQPLPLLTLELRLTDKEHFREHERLSGLVAGRQQLRDRRDLRAENARPEVRDAQGVL